jgi:hypothetical protein
LSAKHSGNREWGLSWKKDQAKPPVKMVLPDLLLTHYPVSIDPFSLRTSPIYAALTGKAGFQNSFATRHGNSLYRPFIALFHGFARD